MPPKKRVAEREDDTKTKTIATRVQTRFGLDLIDGQRNRSSRSITAGELAAAEFATRTNSPAEKNIGPASLVAEYADQPMRYIVRDSVTESFIEKEDPSIPSGVPQVNENGTFYAIDRLVDPASLPAGMITVRRRKPLVHIIDFYPAVDEFGRRVARGHVRFDAKQPHPVFGRELVLDFHCKTGMSSQLLCAVDFYADGGHAIVAEFNPGSYHPLRGTSKPIVVGIATREKPEKGEYDELLRELPAGVYFDDALELPQYASMIQCESEAGWASDRGSVLVTLDNRIGIRFAGNRRLDTFFAERDGDLIVLRSDMRPEGEKGVRMEVLILGNRVKFRLFFNDLAGQPSDPEQLAIQGTFHLSPRFLSCVREQLAAARERRDPTYFALL